MKQEIVAQKILQELLELEICTKENIEIIIPLEFEDIIWDYLNQAYAAGYDEGRKRHSHRKPIAQYSVEGTLIKIWESSALASQHFGLDKTAVSKAALGKHETCAGFRWRFVNLTKPISAEETIGSVKPKSIRPKPRTHFSKKD